MDLTWSFHQWKQILFFQHGNQYYFLLSFGGWIVLYFVIHHCFLWVQKIKDQKFSAILLEAILFLRTKGFQTHLHICVNANVRMLERTHEKGIRLCVLRSLLVAVLAISAHSVAQANHAKYATSAKHLVSRNWSVFKCSVTEVVFLRDIFLILVVRNDKRSSSIDSLTARPTTAFPEIVYITVILSYVYANYCSLNRLSLWLWLSLISYGKSQARSQKFWYGGGQQQLSLNT